MTEIKPVDRREGWTDEEYYAVEDCDGIMRCSCGRELRQLDENTWVCPGGYPIYRFSDESIIIDKFGNLMIKKLDHKPNQKEVNK